MARANDPWDWPIDSFVKVVLDRVQSEVSSRGLAVTDTAHWDELERLARQAHENGLTVPDASTYVLDNGFDR